MKWVLATLICLMFSGSVLAESVEPIMGFKVDNEGIEYQVRSGGCTAKKDFEVRILESHPVQLQLIRKNDDPCTAYIPYGVTIKYTYEELGLREGDMFKVGNQHATSLVPKY